MTDQRFCGNPSNTIRPKGAAGHPSLRHVNKGLFWIAWCWVMVTAAPGLHAEPPNYCLGCMDPSFGTQGQALIPFDLGGDMNDRANAIVRIPGSGKLAIAGQSTAASGVAGEYHFGIAVLNADGTLDPAFGNLGTDDGLSGYGFGLAETDAAWDIAVMLKGNPPDWRLLVVGQTQLTGSSDIDMGLMYIEPDGTLDLTAAHNGRAIFDWAGTDRLTAVATFADRRSAVAAGTTETATPTEWRFLRIDENFNIDITFFDSISFGSVAKLEDVATTYDDKVVAVGSLDVHGDDQMVIARLDAFGSPDIDFGTDGLVYIEVDFDGAADDRAMGVTVDDEGRVVLVGTIGSDDGPMTFLTRLTEYGQIDTSFGVNGYSWFRRTDCQASEGRKVVIDPVGNIVLTYEVLCDGNYGFNLMRFDSDGQIANQDWVALAPFDEVTDGDDRPRGILVQPDGRVVLAGRVQSSASDLDYGVERCYTEIVFADGFESFGWWGADWDDRVGMVP